MERDLCRIVINNAMEALFIHGTDGRFQEVNQQACKALGYDKEEFKKLHIRDVSKNFDPSQIGEMLKQAKVGNTKTFEDVHVRKDGSTFPVEVVVGLLDDGEEPLLFSLARDITNRKLAEARARSEEERFRIFFQSIKDAIFVHPVSEEGFAPFIEVNEIACDRYGYTRDEFLSLSVADIIKPGDDILKSADSFRRNMIAKGQLIIETTHVTRTGEEFPVEINANLVIRDGTPLILSVVRDVTERKRVEAKLRQSEARISGILKALPDMLLQFDRNGVLIDYKAPSETAAKAKPEDFLGKHLAGAFPDKIAARAKWCIDRAFETNEVQLFNYKLDVEGDPREFEARIAIVDDENALATVRDITDYRRALGSLESEGQRLADIIEGTNAGTWDWNVQTGEVELNERWAEILGYTLEELAPIDINTWVNNLHPEDLVNTNEKLEKHFRGELDYYDVVFRQPHKSGGWVWVNARGKVVERTGDGEPVRMRGIHLDITDRKNAELEKLELERQVQHAQKLESLGLLAGGIAHDFNNILMGVLGNAELALQSLDEERPERENLTAIMNAAERAAELAKQMLAYSGKGRFVVKSIDVNQLVNDNAKILSTTMSKNTTLRIEPSEETMQVEADITQLRQVVMNLITNGSEALGDAVGEVVVTTGVAELSGEKLEELISAESALPGIYTYFEVADTGCGMDEKTIEKIFDPFFTTKFTGRGLGLAATQGIVRGHGGAISIESEPGRGTVIRVYFPCASDKVDEPPVEAYESVYAPARAGGGTILVVDDEDSVRDVTRAALEIYGYMVLSAKDGFEGVELFRRRTDEIDLVLLDITMPRMGGEEAFVEMKKIDPDAKVVLSSGYNEHESTTRFEGKGISGFIQKPYKPSDLAKKVREVLKR